jgi:hypothetical protein
MVLLACICKKKNNMLAPEKKGLAPELFLVLSTPDVLCVVSLLYSYLFISSVLMYFPFQWLLVIGC